MSCSQPCTVEEKHFYFSKTRATFQQARTFCKNKGGTLATNLDYEVYRKINSCCTSQHDYWIGLKDDPVLCFSSTEPYHWIEEDSCHSGQPLNIRRQPNNIKCQAITVSINSVNQDLPRAYESDCPSQHHYICQLPSSKMLPYTTPKVFGSLTATSAYSDSSTLDNSSLKIWMIAGGIIALAILVLLLIALCCFYHKKKTNKKKKQTIKRNIVSSKVNSTSTLKTSTSTFISNNNNELNRKGSFHLYYRIDDPVEGISKSTNLPKSSSVCLEKVLESEDGYERLHRTLSDGANVSLNYESAEHKRTDYVQPYENVVIESKTKIIIKNDDVKDYSQSFY